MSDEEMSDIPEKASENEVIEEMAVEESPSEETAPKEESLSSLKAELKRSKGSVFLFVGITVVMFGFALFPMSTNIPYDGLWGTAEKDIGFVWGPSASGEDLMDVPFELEVEVISAPSVATNVTLEAYVLKLDDCLDLEVSEFELIAKQGGSHEYQYSSRKAPLEGQTYTFEFNLDMGEHCAKVQFVDDQGRTLKQNTELKAKGKLWPNQVIAGIPGFIFIGISIYTLLGFRNKNSKVKQLIEQERIEEEKLAGEAATAERISLGPGGPPKLDGPAGPPKSAVGPSGPPKVEKRSGPPRSTISKSSDSSKRSGPPPANSDSVSELVQETSLEVDDSVFEPAGNGYFYRKMVDGSYEQTIYVQSEDGTYSPYQE